MPPSEDLIRELGAAGLTRNEALAYVTLLEFEDPATGYEVAQRSGIPRSAVYTVLRRLEQAGGAFAAGAEPARYAPTDPTRFVADLRREAAERFDRLSTALDRMPKRSHPEPIWILDRYDEVMDRIATMIRSARNSLHLSLWPREIERLREELEAAGRRPLHRVLHSPDHVADPPAGYACWFGSTAADPPKAAWSHKARVVADRREAMIGGTEPTAANRAVWTSNPSIVDLAADALVLDITLLAERTGRDCSADVAPIMRPHLDERPPRS